MYHSSKTNRKMFARRWRCSSRRPAMTTGTYFAAMFLVHLWSILYIIIFFEWVIFEIALWLHFCIASAFIFLYCEERTIKITSVLQTKTNLALNESLFHFLMLYHRRCLWFCSSKKFRKLIFMALIQEIVNKTRGLWLLEQFFVTQKPCVFLCPLITTDAFE